MSYVRSAMLALAALTLLAGATSAGPITFVAAGTLANGSTLSGNVVIDTATGAVNSLNLTLSGVYSFSVTSLGGASLDLASYNIQGGSSDPIIDLVIPVSTLVGYGGGPVCNVSLVCTANGSNVSAAYTVSSQSSFASGSLTPATAAVPEPGTLGLVSAAMAGIVAMRRRRKAV